MVIPEPKALLAKPAFSSFFCFSGNEKSLPEISYTEGKKIQALTGNETNYMLRIFVHSMGLQQSRWNLFGLSSWWKTSALKYSSNDRVSEMLGWKQVQNIIIFSRLVQALTCDCRIASWHIPLWLPPSWMGSHPPDCSWLLAAERSLSFTVTSMAFLAPLSPSAPTKQNTVNNWFFTSQRISSGKNYMKEETSVSPTT